MIRLHVIHFVSLWVKCLTFSLVFVFSVANAAKIPSLSNPNMSQVSDRVFALIGDMAIPNEQNDGFICNSVFIITDKGVIVVDPGGTRQIGEMLIQQIRTKTSKPITHVFNTHHHADHWMGNHAFMNLEPQPIIIGHQIMLDTAKDIGERWLKIISNLTNNKNAGTELHFPNRVVEGNEIMQIGGVKIQLFHPKHAHTKGDIVLYLPDDKILLPGDVLFYLRTPGFQDASPLGNLASLVELNQLDFDKVIPGHGPVTDKSGMEYMINYVKLLHKEVEKYFNEDLSDFEMKDKLDVGDYRTMSGFKDRFGINVNRMYLEVEENSFSN